MINILRLCILLLICTFTANAVERHANLSYARQTIRILPELELKSGQSTPRLIFLHIPKTGGTNLDNISHAVSDMTQAFSYHRMTIPRVAGRFPVKIVQGWIGGLEQLAIHPHCLDHLQHSFFLTGHFPYGVHQQFPLPVKYVALVRNPFERELSTANFAYQRGYISAEEFTSFLLDQTVDNPQVRLIAGREAMLGPCTHDTLAKAIKNIEQNFLLVAPTEDVDTFLQVLMTLQNWGPVAYAPMQITHEKVCESLNPDLMAALSHKHQWDMQLYQWVKARWDTYKQETICAEKTYAPEQPILTLMPEHLLVRQPQWLTQHEIDAHNQAHQEDELLELVQSNFLKNK